VSQKYEDILRDSVEKLSLGPDDIVIVKSQEAMDTFLEMTHRGVGFSHYSNPILFVPGGLEKATKDDLLDALRILKEQAENAGKTEDQISRIITDINAPLVRKVN
jgi:hypothetical protein